MQQTSLYIPKPCHEDWNKMTPTQQGKFCSSCNKQVIDFSLMSDTQVLNFLSHQTGKLCGRFEVDQLQRPLIETKIKKKKSWWMALTMPLLFLFDRSEAQKNTKLTGDTIYSVLPSQETISGQLTRKVAIWGLTKQITITGKVLDENNNPVGFASIVEKGTVHAVMTDSSGNFSIDIHSNDSTITLVASCVAFQAREQQINLNKGNQFLTLRIQPLVAELQDVIVKNYPTQGLIRLGGAVAVCYRVTTFEKVDTSIRKALGISKIFPNPAMRGSNIHLELKQAGSYQMQMLDNQSRLIKTEEINIDSEKSAAQVKLPSNIAAGIYYLRLVNEQTKKWYTEKLIIQ